jgi:hypothetical protein
VRPVGLPDDGSHFFELLGDAGLQQDRIPVLWDPAHPDRIDSEAQLLRTVAAAEEGEIDVVLAVYPRRSAVLSRSAVARAQFVAFLQHVAETFPDVTTFVVGNEFNQPWFYRPQFSKSCARVSGRQYMRLLARGYDTLKAVNPDITVISSVSPRGNDDCHARNNRSTSPVRFVHDMGVEFAALHRDQRAFDEFGINLYPNQPTDSVKKGYLWPKIGTSNLGRLKQALWDAFHGTAQPVPDWQPPVLRYGKSIDELRPVKIWIGEVGWQVRTARAHGYFGRENVRATTEKRQARIYAQLVRMMSCDALVDAMNFFLLVDENDRDRFQTGLLRADWTTRPAFGSVRAAIERASDGCDGKPVQWRHAQNVIGARASFGGLGAQSRRHTSWAFTASTKEDASYRAGVFPVPGRELSDRTRTAIVQSLAGKPGARPVLARRASIKAYWSLPVRFPKERLSRGNYVYAIRIAAAMNPGRTTTFVSPTFRVGS